MPEASKFNDPVNPTVTTRLAYSRVSERTNNVTSVGSQLHICATYSKYVLQRELNLIGDRAETARPLEDVERIGRSMQPAAEIEPRWMRPNFQQFLGKAQAVRLGILVVRNIRAALRQAEAASADNVRRMKATLAERRARMVKRAKARLHQMFPAGADHTVRREAPIEGQRRELEAEMLHAARKRFFAYLAMERAKELNGRRCSRARRFIGARPNRT